MAKFKKTEKVIMLKFDGWAAKGQIGTVVSCDSSGVSVRWDSSGRSYWHKSCNVDHLKGAAIDPNLAFLLRDK